MGQVTVSRPLTARFMLFCALSVLVMMWPSLFNGGAILFFDTSSYFSGAAHALKTVLGVHTHWIHESPSSIASSTTAMGSHDAAQAGQVNAGRSVYYGLLVLIPDAIGSLWLSVAVQSAIMVWALALLLHTLGFARDWLILALCLFLGLLTSVAFFDSYMMPDFLTGIAIVAAATLVAFGSGMRPVFRWQWLVLLVLALSAHNSHILITTALTVFGGLLTWIVTGRPRWRGVVSLVAALAVAGVLQIGFSLAVTNLYGRGAANPPFITARLASEQPGVRYLHATCPFNGFRVCDFLSQLPEDSDSFLWSRDPGTAAFRTATPEVGQALSAEQVHFAVNVLRYDPIGQIAASLDDFGEQFVRFSLSEFAYTDDLKAYLSTMVPADAAPQVERERLFNGRFALEQISLILLLNVILSALVVLYFVVTSAPRARNAAGAANVARDFWLFVILVVAGVVANAAITGILSTPHDRYQARVIWLIPAMMFLIVLFKKRLVLAEPESANGPANGNSTH